LTQYYFDTETTGTDPTEHKIITIQWQELDERTGEPIDELQILKEWESSEKKILKEFLPKIQCNYPWDFIIVGKNLLFDFNFLEHRIKKYGLAGKDGCKEFNLAHVYSRVFIDLKHPLILMNNVQFPEWDRVLDKDGSLAKVCVPDLYKAKKYTEIIKYIKKETKITLAGFKMLREQMPLLRRHL